MNPDDEDDKTFNLEDIEEDVEVDDEEPESEEEVEADDGEPPPRRKESRVQRLANRTKVAEREARELREQLARQGGQIETLTRTVSQPRVDPREEQERIANMSEKDYADYRLGQERSQIQQAFGQVQFQVGDSTDMRDFDRLCRKNDAYAKIEDEVEERIMKLRSQGQNVSRRAMANQILGEKYAAKATKRPEKQETQRRTRTGAGSDVQVDTREVRSKGKTAKERLSGKTF